MFPFQPPSLAIHHSKRQAYKDITGTEIEAEKTMRKTDGEPLASVKISAILTKGVVEDDKKNDTPPFPYWKNSTAECLCAHTHTDTHAQKQQCWQENSLLPGQKNHLLLPFCLCACTIGYRTSKHTSAVLFIVLFVLARQQVMQKHTISVKDELWVMRLKVKGLCLCMYIQVCWYIYVGVYVHWQLTHTDGEL